jgi:hypothetical protein
MQIICPLITKKRKKWKNSLLNCHKKSPKFRTFFQKWRDFYNPYCIPEHLHIHACLRLTCLHARKHAHLLTILWMPCNFTAIHSLTGPVGQPFASCLGGQRFASWGGKTHNGTRFLQLVLSRYIGDPDVIRTVASPPFSGCFTRLCANQCEKPVASHIACLPQFHSTPCRSSSSLQHSDLLEPWSGCWGEPCRCPAISLQYTVSLVQWVNCLLPV